jgi:ABC-type lipoprotein export system ATPase subunit
MLPSLDQEFDMYVTRVQIDEGFLDGIDIQLKKGLNVVIGARGTGKTSLVELIRFCLGVPGYTTESTKKSRNHALSVLGTGQVTITLTDGARTITVSRSAGDAEPKTSGPFTSPIIFSQTEIENVGLQAAGRLKLLDGFVSDRRRSDDLETAAISIIQSISSEVSTLRSEIEELERQLVEIPALEQQIAALLPKEQELLAISAAATEKKKALDVLAQRISYSAVAVSRAERLAGNLGRWKTALQSAKNLAPTTEATTPEYAAHMTKVEEALKRIRDLISQSLVEIENAEGLVVKIVDSATQSKLADEGIARPLRKEIDGLQAGAGSVVSAGQQLRERKAQLDSLLELVKERKLKLDDLLSRRGESQDRLDDVRQGRFLARQQAVQTLLTTLGPRIKVDIQRAGQFDLYASTLMESFKGSGLRYNELSTQIASAVSPRELIEAAERDDTEGFAAATSISLDRAARVLAQVRSSNLGAIASALVEDDVLLQLLDGQAYKAIADLSTGQRCTVVLPIVLQHSDRVLVVDQPEDHIDNAFIVETLIKAILERSSDSQLLVSTHNANIPVLGNASLVVQLASDGHRGFVQCAGPLDSPAIVHAISSVMEGGLEAFRRRAEFYEKNSLV